MCTVSYLPLKGHGFMLTSNRDEAPGRNAESWVEETTPTGEKIFFPQDPQKGGTWICVSSSGRVACLLNGAFEPFQPDPKYRVSRGKIVLDYFNYLPFHRWEDHVDLSETAPFTLVLHDKNRLIECIWDGNQKMIQELDQHVPHFWSSVTLYPPEVRKWRKGLFEEWLHEDRELTQESIMQFHIYGGKGDLENDFIMNRNEKVKTLSVTSIQEETDQMVVQHKNLESGSHIERKVEFQSINL